MLALSGKLLSLLDKRGVDRKETIVRFHFPKIASPAVTNEVVAGFHKCEVDRSAVSRAIRYGHSSP